MAARPAPASPHRRSRHRRGRLARLGRAGPPARPGRDALGQRGDRRGPPRRRGARSRRHYRHAGRRRRRLRVIAVTDGESSHGDRADRAALIRRRVAERQAALDALGAGDAEIIRLGLPDAALDGRDADIAAALDGLVTGFDALRWPPGRAMRTPTTRPWAARWRRSAISSPGAAGSSRSGCGTGPGPRTRACRGGTPSGCH